MSNTTAIHHDTSATDVFGFWVYILTDCILFASLFATFIVLNSPGSFGPSLKSHIDLQYVLVETFVLLTANFTYGLAMLEIKKPNLKLVLLWLLVTIILGLTFIGMELYEFKNLSESGYSWQDSGGSSSFFTLVGTHGLHVFTGVIWMAVLMLQLSIFKFNKIIEKRFVCLGLFWNFLDIVWIFLFSIVYLLGAL